MNITNDALNNNIEDASKANTDNKINSDYLKNINNTSVDTNKVSITHTNSKENKSKQKQITKTETVHRKKINPSLYTNSKEYYNALQRRERRNKPQPQVHLFCCTVM